MSSIPDAAAVSDKQMWEEEKNNFHLIQSLKKSPEMSQKKNQTLAPKGRVQTQFKRIDPANNWISLLRIVTNNYNMDGKASNSFSSSLIFIYLYIWLYNYNQMNTSKAFDLLVSNFYATSIVKGHGAHSNSTDRPTKGF